MTRCARFTCFLVLFAAAVTPACASPPVAPERPECRDEALFAIWAGCVAREVEAGCDTDPVRLCPAIVDACLDRIEQWERCR